MLNIFVTGTDYQVGKTFISAGLAATMQSLGYSSAVYKPIETGALEKNGFTQSADMLFVKTVDPYIKTFCGYNFKQKITPSIAAEEENIIIDKLTLNQEFQAIIHEHDCTIIEGIGGVSTPISTNFVTSDLIKQFDSPVLFIVNPQLSTINQILLGLEHLFSKGINVSGVVINNFTTERQYENREEIKNLPRLIEEYSDAKIIGIIRDLGNTKKINPSDLITEILNGIDIESVFDVKISKLEIE